MFYWVIVGTFAREFKSTACISHSKFGVANFYFKCLSLSVRISAPIPCRWLNYPRTTCSHLMSPGQRSGNFLCWIWSLRKHRRWKGWFWAQHSLGSSLPACWLRRWQCRIKVKGAITASHRKVCATCVCRAAEINWEQKELPPEPVIGRFLFYVFVFSRACFSLLDAIATFHPVEGLSLLRLNTMVEAGLPVLPEKSLDNPGGKTPRLRCYPLGMGPP